MPALRRREFITLLGGATAWPLAARAQQSHKVPRIGVLLPGTPTSFAPRTKAFVEGLQDLGYVEGRTVAFEWKCGQDRVESTRSGRRARGITGRCDRHRGDASHQGGQER